MTWSFDEAVAWLRTHYNLETGVTNDVASTPGSPDAPALPARQLDTPSLDRLRRLLSFLGDPQLDLDIIHITGTNGKGSSARMATQLLLADGRSVGTYTSPDLESVTERLAIAGEPVSQAAFAEVFAAVALAEDHAGVRCSYFELLTAAAFRLFSDEAVEAAVVEVGAGGRWDATNVGDGAVGVITNIELDHQEWFGDTRLDIAREKVGIVKPGSTLLIGESDSEIVLELEREANRLGVERIWTAGVDFACDTNRLAVGGRVCTLRTPSASYRDVFVPLHGAHQGDNAAIALGAVEAFLGAPLADATVRDGFAHVTNPGRLEVVSRSPLVVLDGAHNPAGAKALGETLRDAFSAASGRVIVVGLLRGRDPHAMLEALDVGDARLVIVTSPPSPRAMPVDDVAVAARRLRASVRVVPDVAEALRVAEAEADETDLVLVTGSLYLIGAARRLLRHR
jgi:dihydrofolate synthase / folylpolyglutamate synthase